ncbi:MAG: hypothetical protein KKA73_18630 [Chloroflexi bacterium]|nr:hypothetical protein [Chloroflexota bacterium]
MPLSQRAHAYHASRQRAGAAPRDVATWRQTLDLEPGIRGRHTWAVNPDQVRIRWRQQTFAGVMTVHETVSVPYWWVPGVTAAEADPVSGLHRLYRVEHPVWCIGPGAFTCGTHGTECHAVDITAAWLQQRDQPRLTCYTFRLTWDGRVAPVHPPLVHPVEVPLWLRLE